MASFEFPDSIHLVHFIGKARALLQGEKYAFITPFSQSSAKTFHHLTPKCFLLNIFSRTQISEISSWGRSIILAAPVAKFGPLREPIRIIHNILLYCIIYTKLQQSKR